MKKTRTDITFDILNYIFMIIVMIVMLYPLYFTVIASVSEPTDVALGAVTFLPSSFSLDAYKNVFDNSSVWVGYKNTIIYTLCGTFFSLVLTIPSAYVMSKKRIKGRSFFTLYFLVPMFFNGGLIPTYLLVKSLDLLNKSYTLIVLEGLSIYNLIVTRIFYQTSIPEEIYEASRIDGSTDFGQFFRIAIPLSAPIIAVMALFYGVSRWNSYFSAMIYLSDSALYPLQLVLRNILIQNQTALLSINVDMEAEEILSLTKRAYMAEAMKYALIFISSAPLLIAYPFVQKYFVKGVMIGSLKG